MFTGRGKIMKIRKSTEKKIDVILRQMTLEEKVAMCHANSKFTNAGVPRLGIGELTMHDGPHGVRAEMERDAWRCLNRPEDDCTYLPTETALAATFNPVLAFRFGKTLGEEARHRGKDIILGPGVNVIRTPLCGRNFEYMSEDPFLISAMAPSLVKGIESTDTAACVKHYALNNQELDRTGVNVEVSPRALHEIYLRGFRAAIMDGGASSVMGAYNLYENQHCCHNKYLVNTILKEKWGFPGVFMTDWNGAHDTEECIYNGLDLEMGTTKPYNEYYLADAFLARAKESEEVRRLLDDKVRRILRLEYSVRKFSPLRKKGSFNTKAHQKETYDIAKEAMVLLKNDKKLLPIDKDKYKKILVMGPNADQQHARGGNSSGVHALYEITPLSGIKKAFEDCEITYERGAAHLAPHPIEEKFLNIIDEGAGCRACKVTAKVGEGETVSFCDTFNITEGTADSYRMELSCHIPAAGLYSFVSSSNAPYRVLVNDAVVDEKKIFAPGTVKGDTCGINAEAGEDVAITVEVNRRRNENINFTFGWLTPEDHANSSDEQALLDKVADADLVIYCGGLDHGYDTESFDKKSLALPVEQQNMIPKVLGANENTILVMTAGSPFEMPWEPMAGTILWTWYAGMEGGNVLGDILLGKICPSGKMPFTLPRRYEDTPVARYGEYKAVNCRYNDDIYVGYRGFDKDGLQPLYPFGYGLSYSEFAYSDLSATLGNDAVNVTFTLENTGAVTAGETAQVYVSYPDSRVERAPKELKGFAKIFLKPGQKKKLLVSIPVTELAYYDETVQDFVVEHGKILIHLASSAADIRMTAEVGI